MTTAANLVRRYRTAGDGVPGVGTGKPPVRILSVLKRVLPGVPDYNVSTEVDAPHMFTYKADARISITADDLKMWIRNGFLRMRVNSPGHITFYFGPTGAEVVPPVV